MVDFLLGVVVPTIMLVCVCVIVAHLAVTFIDFMDGRHR